DVVGAAEGVEDRRIGHGQQHEHDQGRLQAAGPPTDPTVQQALGRVFGGALRIEPDRRGRLHVRLALDED
ncbi:MAG TPA: hypothetical protein PLF63_13895, partial [Rubrivivax sp.]|nr:hypothetical protein [Rubrivivax sp.]